MGQKKTGPKCPKMGQKIPGPKCPKVENCRTIFVDKGKIREYNVSII